MANLGKLSGHLGRLKYLGEVPAPADAPEVEPTCKAQFYPVVDITQGGTLSLPTPNDFLDTSSEVTSLGGVFIPENGEHVFVTDSTGGNMYQYDMGTAGDINTASYASKSMAKHSGTVFPSDLWFSPNGKRIYVIYRTPDVVFQEDLAVAWDLSSGVGGAVSYNFSAESTDSRGIALSADGTKMYISSLSGVLASKLIEYNLGTAWDITTAEYNGVTYSMGSIGGLYLDPNGEYMYCAQLSGDYVQVRVMTTPWDLSTLTTSGYGANLMIASSNVDTGLKGVSTTNKGKTVVCSGIQANRVNAINTTTRVPDIG